MNRLSSTLLTLAAGTGALATLALAAPSGTPSVEGAAPSSAPPAPASPASAVREIELPLETGTYRQGEGVQLAQTYCMTCHSVEYCETQPPSAEKYWGATVKKMKEKFGAPLPEEAIAPLTKYLTEAYGKPAR